MAVIMQALVVAVVVSNWTLQFQYQQMFVILELEFVCLSCYEIVNAVQVICS